MLGLMKSSPKFPMTKRIEALLEELIRLQKEHSGEQVKQQIATLSPRRQEIIAVIRDHKMVSFDFLSRNFRGVPQRTLHYDLKQLGQAGYITKLGTTRGVLYVPGE